MTKPSPLVTVAVPSFNHAAYLEEALVSLYAQDLPIEVFVADGGSTDDTRAILEKWSPRLAGWRSHADGGQSAAINEAVGRGTAPYVTWLNSDDLLLPNGLATLVERLQQAPGLAAAYGRAWNLDESGRTSPVRVEPFDPGRLAIRCIISQPACLIRRSAWEAVGGVDERLHMAMDYDLWWRLWQARGPFELVDAYVAVNRLHGGTKTRRFRSQHYREATAVVRRYNGSVPAKWWLWRPYAVWAKALFPRLP